MIALAAKYSITKIIVISLEKDTHKYMYVQYYIQSIQQLC